MRKLAVVLMLLAAACGNNKSQSGASTATSTPASSATAQKCQDRNIPAPANTGSMQAKPTVDVPDGAPPCKLVIQDIRTGTGAAAKAGTTVTVQYVGVSWSTRQQFDASWDHGGPIPLSLGQVIAGWQQGIPGMKEGGRRRLIIPPELGYGASGSPPAIGPNETLVFVIDLIKAS